MKALADERVTRYVRLLVHDHPLRARDYVDALLVRGWSAEMLARQILLPARSRVISLRSARKLNAADAGLALGLIRTALAGLLVNDASLYLPKLERVPVNGPPDWMPRHH